MLHLPKKMRYLPYLLIAPAFLLICIFKLYPIVLTVIESFIVGPVKLTRKTNITTYIQNTHSHKFTHICS